MSNGLEVAAAAFQATTEARLTHIEEAIKQLWRANEKLSGELSQIRNRIAGGIMWLAVAAGGVLFQIARSKIGL